MTQDVLLSLGREALLLMVLASLPPIGASLVVGFLMSLFQATTQLQEQTLSFAPKLVSVLGVLAIAGPWIGDQLVRFTFHVFDQFPALIK